MKSPKRIKLMVLLVASMLLLCGCKIGNTEIVYLQNIWPNQVFKIDDEVCSKKEARVYLVNYRNIYGASYGVDLWQQDSNEESLETYIKEKALTQMARIKCMNGLAKEKDISLAGEEKKKAAKAAETYYKSLSKEERKYLDVKQSDLEDMYQEYLLAAKVYQSLTDKVDTEISDDEARVMEVMQIFVSDEKKAEEIKARLQNGEDFAALAGSYNEKGSIQTSFGREDVPEEVAEEAFELDNDQITDAIKTDEGYYFIKCMNKYNRKLTDENKETLLEERKQEAFNKEYHAYMESVSKVLNQRLWEKTKVDAPKEIKTDSFFEVID